MKQTESTKSNEQQALNLAVKALDGSVDQLAPEIRSRLAEIRQRAVEEGSRQPKATKSEMAPEGKVIGLAEYFTQRFRQQPQLASIAAGLCIAMFAGVLWWLPQAEKEVPIQAWTEPLINTNDAANTEFFAMELATLQVDETEWAVVEELEFAVWLSEQLDETET